MAYNKVEYAGKVLVDLTGDTVTSDTLFDGQTAHGKDGEPVVGTFSIDQELTEQGVLIEQLKAALADKATGTSLNYSVVYSTTQPSSATENTIWINTDVEVPCHVFSATEPENPVDGMVWFSVGVASSAPINVLKKDNTLMVYPVSCKQYVSGALVNKTAKTYQDGAWVEWTFYLFKGAEDMTFVSGGWEKYSGSGTVTEGDGVLSFSMPGKQWGSNSGIMRNKTAVDMGLYSSISITFFPNYWSFNSATFHVYDASGTSVASVDIGGTTNQTLTKTIDISGLTGEFYFGLALSSYWDGNSANETKIDVYEVQLIP